MKKNINEHCGQPDGSFEKFIKDNPDPNILALNAKDYPHIVKLGIPITKSGSVRPQDLQAGLKRNKLNANTFHKHFGVQTCGAEGPYAHDVESVLERMINKKLTGTQLFWD